jgi:hypothetical protein
MFIGKSKEKYDFEAVKAGPIQTRVSQNVTPCRLMHYPYYKCGILFRTHFFKSQNKGEFILEISVQVF